jgi:hypothetical protein
MKKYILIIVLCFFALGAFSQKIRYKDVKRDYSKTNYFQTIEKPRRSLLLAGGLALLYPGLGHVYIGEPLRGACFAGGVLISFSASMYGFVLSTEYGSSFLMFSGIASFYVLWLWNIQDVLNVTQIKNLAYQDRSISMHIYPSLFYNNTLTNSNSVGYGLGLSVRF